MGVYILKVVNKRQAPTSSPTFKSGKSFQMAGNSSHDDFADTNNESIKKSKQDKYSHPVYKQISLMNGKINSYSKLELIQLLKSLRLETEGNKNILIKRLKNFYRQTLLNVAGVTEQNENGKIKFVFNYYVVIDFEATCELVKSSNFQHEIIEFPAVLVNGRTCKIEDEFRSYCRPVINPLLSEFCTDLTGITQDVVDKAPLFIDALASFEEWLSQKQLGTKYSFAIVTDDPWDMGKFPQDQCKLSQVEFPAYSRYWVNIRKIFANFYNTSRLPLSAMIQLIGQEFQGRAHSGLDDSRNIAAILQRVLKDGAKVIFNEKLAEDNPVKYREDGSPYFSANVTTAEFKPLNGNLRPNFPGKQSVNK